MNLFDVVAVNLKDKSTRIIASAKSEQEAEAIVQMAVMRRGVDVEFFKTSPHKPAERREEKP